MMPAQRQSVTLAHEPRGDLYRALLVEALRLCNRFSLVQRGECIIDESAKAILAELSPHLREERSVSEWPGTRLLNGMAILREYELNEATAAILGRTAGLYDWCQPSRPEDLTFLRTSRDPWLVTIAHERDAYFEVTPPEWEDLLRRVPALSSAI
jgi:hypothetical protein